MDSFTYSFSSLSLDLVPDHISIPIFPVTSLKVRFAYTCPPSYEVIHSIFIFHSRNYHHPLFCQLLISQQAPCTAFHMSSIHCFKRSSFIVNGRRALEASFLGEMYSSYDFEEKVLKEYVKIFYLPPIIRLR